MSAAFACRTAELTDVPADRLGDAATLAALLIAAAGAAGLTTDGPPVIRGGATGAVVAVVGIDGHILLHTSPPIGVCLVNIAVRTPRNPDRALEVISRRLGVTLSPAPPSPAPRPQP